MLFLVQYYKTAVLFLYVLCMEIHIFFFLTKSFALLFNIYWNFSVIKGKIGSYRHRNLCQWYLFDI